jgi:membrane fusion protein, macrolide-specific efflux system
VVAADATTSQIGEVLDGEQAVITPTGATTNYYGVVTSYSTTGTTSDGVTSFPVTIAVTGSPSGLYPGASASIELIIRQVNNVLEVPTSAVHTLGTASFVYVLKNGKEVDTPITIGATGDAETQVVSGLKSGQLVVIASLTATVPSGTGGATGGFTRFGGGGLGGGGGGFGGGGFGGGGGAVRVGGGLG